MEYIVNPTMFIAWLLVYKRTSYDFDKVGHVGGSNPKMHIGVSNLIEYLLHYPLFSRHFILDTILQCSIALPFFQAKL